MGKQLGLSKNSYKLAASRKFKTFLETWDIQTKESEILEIIKEFKIPFLKNPTQKKVSRTPEMGQEQKSSGDIKDGEELSYTADRASG